MNTISKSAGLFFVVTLCVSGCASVSVEKETWKKDGLRTPQRIVVDSYRTPASSLRVDRDGEALAAFQSELAEGLETRLVERLSKNIAPAIRLSEAGKVSAGEWIIGGEFLRVNQGSRLLRSLFGWGLGGTKMEVRTEIFRMEKGGKRERLAEIWTTGGSNAEPGAVFGGPFAAAPRLVLNASLTGVSADSRRTARVVVAAISERLTAVGQPVAGEPLQAKRLGGVPTSSQTPRNLHGSAPR